MKKNLQIVYFYEYLFTFFLTNTIISMCSINIFYIKKNANGDSKNTIGKMHYKLCNQSGLCVFLKYQDEKCLSGFLIPTFNNFENIYWN